MQCVNKKLFRLIKWINQAMQEEDFIKHLEKERIFYSSLKCP